MSSSAPKTARVLLEEHEHLRERFESAQQRREEAVAAYKIAKSELTDFRGRFGRILSLFED